MSKHIFSFPKIERDIVKTEILVFYSFYDVTTPRIVISNNNCNRIIRVAVTLGLGLPHPPDKNKGMKLKSNSFNSTTSTTYHHYFDADKASFINVIHNKNSELM